MPVSKPIPHDILKFIPQYDGTCYKLPQFISTCQELYDSYCNETITERSENHWLIFRAAVSRLSGPAEAVVFNNNCETITAMIAALKTNFADNRAVPDLIAEITFMKSYSNEHPIEFVNRLDEKRTTVLTKYKLDGISGELLNNLMRQLNATLTRTLIHGVHPVLGSHLQILQIQNLDDARHKLINDCSIVLRNLNFKSNVDTINKIDSRAFNHTPMRSFNTRTPDFLATNKTFTNSFSKSKTPNFFRSNNNGFQKTSPQNNFQQPFAQNKGFQQNFPPNQTAQFPQQQRANQFNNFVHNNSQFRQPQNNNTKWDSQNTVSMRTVQSNPSNRFKTKSPFEVNYLDDSLEPTDNSTQNFDVDIQSMQSQLNSLTDAINNMQAHFLEVGSYPEETPSDDLN